MSTITIDGLPEVMRRLGTTCAPYPAAKLAYDIAEAMLDERRRREMPFGM